MLLPCGEPPPTPPPGSFKYPTGFKIGASQDGSYSHRSPLKHRKAARMGQLYRATDGSAASPVSNESHFQTLLPASHRTSNPQAVSPYSVLSSLEFYNKTHAESGFCCNNSRNVRNFIYIIYFTGRKTPVNCCIFFLFTTYKLQIKVVLFLPNV